jgi:hypothetical protein
MWYKHIYTDGGFRKIGQKLWSGVSGEAAELQASEPIGDMLTNQISVPHWCQSSDVTSPSIYLDFISVALGSERKATVLASYCFSIRMDQPNYPA